ncbi:MAG: DUF3131 domain-containing protein [Candidatus Theseobacter exili]|nr:DUF3131 domain-containing protein [Candidatus Theseobacter exili]
MNISTKETNHRKYIRLKSMFPVEFRLINESTGGYITELEQGFTHDVGLGGICLEVNDLKGTLERFLKDTSTHIELYLNLPGEKEPLPANSRIAWTKSKKTTHTNRISVGLDYTQIDSKIREKIFKYAKRVKRKTYLIWGSFVSLFAIAVLFSSMAFFFNQQQKIALEKLSILGRHKVVLETRIAKRDFTRQLLEGKRRQLQELVSELESKIDKYESSKGVSDSETEKVFLEKAELEKKLQEVSVSMKELKSQISSVSDERKEMEKELSNMRKTEKELDEKITRKKQLVQTFLKNGNELQGYLVEDRDDALILDLGYGISTLPKERIKSWKILSSEELKKFQGQQEKENTIIKQLKKKFIKTEQKTQKKVYYEDLLKPFSQDQIDFLKKRVQNSWESMNSLIEPVTGLPYGSSQKFVNISMSDIGLYLSCLAIAAEIGLESRKSAERKLIKVLNSLEQIDKWHGIPRTWVNLKTLQPVDSNAVSFKSGPTGYLASGLILARSVFPSKKEQITRLLDSIRWGVLYDPKTSWLFGGYNLEKKEFSSWHCKYLGSDSRLSSFLSIASGQVPTDHWKALNREQESRYGFNFYVPGWNGGIGLQGLPSLFLPEKDTEMGNSLEQFFKAQIEHARRLGLKAWGWSVCLSPDDEVLGWGSLEDDIVTPSAASLGLASLPVESVNNLVVLKDMGITGEVNLLGESRDCFVDSIDVKTGDKANEILFLNQAITFLSIANILRDGLVWRTFIQDPLVKNGLKKISDFANASEKSEKS